MNGLRDKDPKIAYESRDHALWAEEPDQMVLPEAEGEGHHCASPIIAS
jgi:hypothetical protein